MNNYKKTIITGYFGEKHVCNGCVVRGGSQFNNILQPIYLIISHLEKKHDRITDSYIDKEITENYCYICARNEVKEIDKELFDCWSEINNKQEKNNYEKCVNCQLENNNNNGEFRKHDGKSYCLKCLIWLKG